LKCHEFACCSFVKIACDIWNNSDGLSVTDISKQMNLSRSVVRKYLKQGVGLGWCDYDPKKETENKYDKMRRKIVQLSDCGHFIREWNYIKEAADLLQINKSNITQVCKGRDKSAGGYIWMYLNDYKKHNNVLNVNIGKRKRVVQLSLTDEFLNEWKSLTEANFSLDIGINRICAVCKGKSKTAGGYKWMYKEDYDQYIEQAK
jgi:predicted transcriptional regulator